MFSRFTVSSLQALSMILALALLPSAAHASAHKDALADQPFDVADQVSDQDLSKMRGGFLDINGVLIDISFLSRVQVGLDTQANLNVNTDNLATAAASATQIQQLLQPQIITNVDANTLISIQQALSVNVLNPGQISALQGLQQFGFTQALGH